MTQLLMFSATVAAADAEAAAADAADTDVELPWEFGELPAAEAPAEAPAETAPAMAAGDKRSAAEVDVQWVLLKRDTPAGVTEMCDDALEASRAAMRAAAGLAPAAANARSPAPAATAQGRVLKSTPKTPRDKKGRRVPKRRPKTGVERDQEEEWKGIQAAEQVHREEQVLQREVKAVWGEHFREQLAGEGNKAAQRAAMRTIQNEADYIVATGKAEKKRTKAGAAREARRMHDLTELEKWRGKQGGAASAARAAEEAERAKNEAAWRQIQAKKNAQTLQHTTQKQIVAHRTELHRLLRAVETQAARAGGSGEGGVSPLRNLLLLVMSRAFLRDCL